MNTQFKTPAEEVEFLKSVIDRLTLCAVTNGGDAVMSRAEFNKSQSDPNAPTDYSYEQFIDDSMDDQFAEDDEPEEINLNCTSCAYELASWTAILTADNGYNTINTAVNIERLREIVAAADKDWSLLVAREEGNA